MGDLVGTTRSPMIALLFDNAVIPPGFGHEHVLKRLC